MPKILRNACGLVLLSFYAVSDAVDIKVLSTKAVGKSGDKYQVKASCTYKVADRVEKKGARMTVQFNKDTMKFKSGKLTVLSSNSTTYQVTNKKPIKSKKFKTVFSVQYTGTDVPSGTCSDLQILTTTASTSQSTTTRTVSTTPSSTTSSVTPSSTVISSTSRTSSSPGPSFSDSTSSTSSSTSLSSSSTKTTTVYSTSSSTSTSSTSSFSTASSTSQISSSPESSSSPSPSSALSSTPSSSTSAPSTTRTTVSMTPLSSSTSSLSSALSSSTSTTPTSSLSQSLSTTETTQATTTTEEQCGSDPEADADCTADEGTCQEESADCSGSYWRGLCGGPSHCRCCFPQGECELSGGVCQSYSDECNGTFVTGRCQGPDNRKCCVADDPCDMTEEELDQLRETLEQDEGVLNEIYNDHFGNPTFGIGHLITPNDPEHGSPVGTSVDDQRVEEAYQDDVETARTATNAWSNDCDEWPPEVLQIILNMMFNMGLDNMLEFENFRDAVREGDWSRAADEMEDSEWADQVPNRAQRLTDRMRAVGDK